MNLALAVAGSVVALVAAGIHGMIFVLESILWTRPSTRRTFGVRSADDAEVLRPMAFNLGFYNLFLGIGALLGLVLLAVGATEAGVALVLFALASMLLAAVVLLASNPRMLRAALVQGAAPAVGILLLVLGLVVP